MSNPENFIPIIESNRVEKNDEKKNVGDVTQLPVLPLRNMVMFPNVIMPISIARAKSLKLVRHVNDEGGYIAIFAQKKKEIEDPQLKDLYAVGVMAKIIKLLDLPDGSTTVLVEGKYKIELLGINETEPYLKGEVVVLNEAKPRRKTNAFTALALSIKDIALKMIKMSPNLPNEASFTLNNIEDEHHLINYVSSNFWFDVKDKQKLLEIENLNVRGTTLLELLTKEMQMLDLKLQIQTKAKMEIDEQQKEYFLQQQLKAIQEQLGNGSTSEIEAYKKKIKNKKAAKEVKEVMTKSLQRMEKLNPSSPDYAVESNYIDTLLSVPFQEYSKDNLDIKRARKILDSDHFGMEKIKDRILEHLSVLKLKGNMKSPIICLYGAPGVGKTSLGKSIAAALERKYVRISLGGVHDEAEIRGHRRTYIGAMAGQIVKSLIKAKTANPVFILDEIDKVSQSSINGDPSSALLEVLDPEQNSAFHDNFLDVDVDLSKIMFIATANSLDTIPRPLLDRMELINVDGYVEEEKIAIASKHLIRKQEEANGLPQNFVKIEKSALKEVISSYTFEAGVRNLDRCIAKIMRNVAGKLASDKELKNITVKKEDIEKYLGKKKYFKDKYEGNDYCGVVAGLAWTAAGGTILTIECAANQGKVEKLSMTGNLGKVMKESATLAYKYVKIHADELGIDEKTTRGNIHIHVPEGATPKDGPSAGITLTTAIVSALKHKKVKKGIAMTGEVTLRGKVMPVGGIKEKILAAKMAGINEIILCDENKRDIAEINSSYLKGMTFNYVSDMKEVLKISQLI